MYNNPMNNTGNDYIDKIKAIPILQVCQVLGIKTVKLGSRYWCKLRMEKDASTLLNTDKSPNTYIDFGGSNKEGDVIQFVADYKGTDRSDAIRDLASAFNIRYEKQNPNELATWEWKKIGLYGDIATKNFTFDLERQGIQRVAELSEKYGMPMNELRKKHKKIYEQLLYDKALPHILDLRNNYYLTLINTYHMAHTTDLTTLPSVYDEMLKSIQELCTAEWIFKRAAERTAINAYDPGEYEPNADLGKILAGDLKPYFGTNDYDSLQDIATAMGCKVKRWTVPQANFTSKGFEKEVAGEYYPFNATYQGDQIVIRYLACDYAALKPHLEMMSGRASLSEKISDAEKKRQCNTACSDKNVQHAAER